ncbi:TIGR03749 family integrating conjugative element protein [Pseudomonas aeruginosa]|uniref:TIGR03749 family integrating conjugative element protein n=1 Tax=Pseudomonas aeruginosa TaxID=287 RepID=UPI0027C1675B|nr:TIGR03749 family integrating conjugative element protein [Pseudomonas aeruginosa]MDQ2578928.1 TIGR03749 family integrating conjugative element protein [Pseudomonas aeruginosa]MDQ2605621.1 TIGR03749 family integrating conjugative element protein [Pseudomonas aeruginosa]MDT8189573.1 TIGR03749 family integrating conjugative element protein [Pseudomonas aeruginosa]MDT8211605.1 TIGR03749 family integrating conjugative element protein [Pseudomonas aeruginosa]HBP6530099.1 TIGR03749 family integrat
MNRLLPLALAAFALVPFSAPQAIEIMRWERLPLALPLQVDQERVVFVERNVRVGVPASLGNRLRVQSAAGAIYLLASEPIEPTRLQLQDADTGTVMLLDIAAERAQDGQPTLEPVRIIDAASAAAASAADEGSATTPPVRSTPQPVILTRFAAQNLYAPLRTVEPVPGVVLVTLRRDLPLDTLLPTLPIQAQVLAAWRLDNLWVSAVRLRNSAAHWLELDPRALQGHFLAATFQHPTLGPSDTQEDTTVVYLVTRGHGLAQALLPAIAPVDAALNLPAPTGGHDAQ